jgi:hypothetical protein
MRDAAAHLASADHADFSNRGRHAVGTDLRPLFDLDHVLSLTSIMFFRLFYADLDRDTTGRR